MTKEATPAQIEAVRRELVGLVVITGDSAWDMDYVARRVLAAVPPNDELVAVLEKIAGLGRGPAASLARSALDTMLALEETS